MFNKGMPIRYDCGCVEYPVVGHEMLKTPNWIVCPMHGLGIKLFNEANKKMMEARAKKGGKGK